MGQILLSELQSWYNAINNIVNISKGSASNNQKDFGNISISSSTTAKASDINALATKLNAFKNDSILGSNSTDQALYGSPGTVSAGGIIQTGTKSSYDTIVTNLAVIKCRNSAANSYGVCGQGTCSSAKNNDGVNSNGNKSHGNNTWGKKSNVGCMEGTYSRGGLSNMLKSNGTYSSGYNSRSTCTNGTCSSGNKSNSTKQNGTNNNERNNHGTIIDIRNSQSSKTHG